ncbi:hypothetical protein OESDEN_03148 [Oesophagostomum dentatum]|uniref:Protein kinase domain-containing protein n=1 Tax=Oesophagostomum dentatum TaxID=61180 RepID=A0A0B1TM19_OESDE|nr:hypothetical protein OESDEN_03148 [Oesophagostomum dentatum]
MTQKYITDKSIELSIPLHPSQNASVFQVKISDFGLSRMGSHYVLKTAVKLPIKWLAPETISTFTFSLKSDVYTFGVLVFEIFANGAEPWDGFTNSDVKAAVSESFLQNCHNILSGKCLTFPNCCPEKLRDFFTARVFTTTPAHRASMAEVVKMLRSLCPNAAPSSGSEQKGSTKRRHVLKYLGMG